MHYHVFINSISWGIYQWSNGDPMSYQLWLNSLDSRHSNVIFKAFSQIYDGNYFYYNVKISNDLYKKEEYLRHKTHPVTDNKYTCSLMMVHNLAEPEWLSIMCDQALLSHVLCAIDSADMDYSLMFTNKKSISQKEWCQHTHVKKGNGCFVLYWQTKEYLFVSKHGHRIANLKSQLHSLKFLFTATSAQISPILLSKETSPVVT